jgi:hypothetical protein
MKKLTIAIATIFLLTGCSTAATVETDETNSTSPEQTVEPTTPAAEEPTTFTPSEADQFELIALLERTCAKANTEGVTESLADGTKSVLLPESEGYESYRAFYYITEDDAGLIFSTEDLFSCSVYNSAQLFLEGSEDGATLADFPLAVQKIDESTYRIQDSSSGEGYSYEANYTFTEGVLTQVDFGEDFVLSVEYGAWTPADKALLKDLVKKLQEG